VVVHERVDVINLEVKMFAQIVKSVVTQMVAHYVIKSVDSVIERVTTKKEPRRVEECVCKPYF
jgi:hypothetical protein